GSIKSRRAVRPKTRSGIIYGSSEERQAMTAGHGAEYCQQAGDEQYHVHPLQAPQRHLWIAFLEIAEVMLQDKRFKEEQHEGEDEPHQRHGVQPPELQGLVPRPAVRG